MVDQATQYTIKKVPLKQVENLKLFWLFSGTVEDAIKKFEVKFDRPATTAYVCPNGSVYIPVESEE